MNKEEFLAGVTEKYPPELLEDRYMIESSVVGCLVNDLLLMDDAHLKVGNFVTHDCRFIYNILDKLRMAKCVECDPHALKHVLTPEEFNEVEERGGYSELRRLTQNIDLKNFDVYLESIRKSNLLMKLHAYGFNVTRPIKYKKETIIPLEKFKDERFTSEMIAQWYSNILDETSININNKVLEETTEFKLGQEFFDRIEKGEDKGVPFAEFDILDEQGIAQGTWQNRCLSYFSGQVNGIPNGLTMLCGYSNIGKTTLMIQILMSMIHSGCKCMIITNEQRKKDFELSFLTLFIYIYHKDYEHSTGIDRERYELSRTLTKSVLKNNLMDARQLALAKEMQEIWDRNYADKIEFVSLEDSDTDLAVRKMKVAIAARGVTTCVYDTFKLDMPAYVNNKKNMAEYLQLIQDSRKFEALARRYENVQIICTVQLAEATRGEMFPTAAVLSQSKQVKEVCDLMILLRNTYPEELDCNNRKYYCRPYRDEKNEDGKYQRRDYVAPEGMVFRTVFIEKSRNSGNVSTDNGVAYLFSFDGNYGFWKDMAKCKPVQGKIGTK